MAEQERLTKKQRRAKAREQRQREAAAETQRRRREAVRKGLITVGILAMAGLLIFQAFFVGDESLDDAILVSSDEIESAEQAAGCETLAEREPLPESAHIERDQAPPLDAVYPQVRPTHSGPHTPQTVPPVGGGSPSQLDEFTSTHNLEHGAIMVWYDPDQVDEATAEEMGDWSRTLNDSGFGQDRGGGAIMVSPYEEPGISSGKAVALRAWGTAVDCDEWDETIANGFVAQHYGTRGIGPEGTFSPYPEGVLEISDQDPGDDASGESEPEDAEGDGTEEPEDAEGDGTEEPEPDEAEPDADEE